MENIDDKIYRHICCDYQYSPIREDFLPFLTESQGSIPEIDTYVACFRDFVEGKIFPFIKGGGTMGQEITNAGIFSPIKNRFFDSCKIYIIASIANGNPSWHSNYEDDKSFYSTNWKHIVINISCGAPNEEVLISLLCSNFAHELTHAYDDYRSQLYGDSSLRKAIDKSQYTERGVVWSFGNGDNAKMLGKVLYLLSPMERNALIGQISTELSGKATRDPKTVLAAVKETTSYRQYRFLKQSVEKINNTTDGNAQNELLDAYTKWIGYNKHKNKLPDKTYNVRKNLTYEGFLSELNAMFKKWERKYLTVVGKIAYNHYLFKELPIGYSSDNADGMFNAKEPFKNTVINEVAGPDGMEYYYDWRWNVNEC